MTPEEQNITEINQALATLNHYISKSKPVSGQHAIAANAALNIISRALNGMVQQKADDGNTKPPTQRPEDKKN